MIYTRKKKEELTLGKKKIVTIGAVIVAVVVGLAAFQSTTSQAEAKLTTDDIRKIVEDQYTGKITELELDKEDGKAVYEVELSGEKKEYDLKLDGTTGEVLHLSEEPLSKESKEEKDDSDDDINDEDKENQDLKNSNSKKPVIEDKKAEETALKEFDGKIISNELDEDDGRLVYEIEIHKDKKEADIEIDAITGEVVVVSIEQDDNDNDDDNEED